MPLSIKNRKNQISHIARHIASRVKFDFLYAVCQFKKRGAYLISSSISSIFFFPKETR